MDANLQVPTVFRSGSSGSCRHGSGFGCGFWLFVVVFFHARKLMEKGIKNLSNVYITYILCILCICVLSCSLYMCYICIFNLNVIKC